MREIKVTVEKLDGEIVIMFPDGDYIPVASPIHEFLFQLAVASVAGGVLTPVEPDWDGNSFTVVIPADARLMAASPLMYEALKGCLEALDDCSTAQAYGAKKRKAKQALAKAEGK